MNGETRAHENTINRAKSVWTIQLRFSSKVKPATTEKDAKSSSPNEVWELMNKKIQITIATADRKYEKYLFSFASKTGRERKAKARIHPGISVGSDRARIGSRFKKMTKTKQDS